MRHLDSLTIGAFRGLRDVKLEGLGGVNVLVRGQQFKQDLGAGSAWRYSPAFR